MLLFISAVTTFLTPLLVSLTAIFACSKKKQHPITADSTSGLKSKCCNKSTGLGNDNPDLIKLNKNVVNTNVTKLFEKAVEISAPPTQSSTKNNSKMTQPGKNKPTSSREQMSKEQCDTDLRSFLSEIQKNSSNEKFGDKAKQEEKNHDKTEKPLSLAVTQKMVSKKSAEKKSGEKNQNKPNVEPTQNESIKTVVDEKKIEPRTTTVTPTPVKKLKSSMCGVDNGENQN